MKSPFLRTLGACVCLLSSFACGGSGSDPQAGGGISGSGTVVSLTWGPVTGVGSVIVSGNEYDVTTADINVDDREGVKQSELKKGMIVQVTGVATEDYGPTEARQRIATAIVYKDTVQGLVEWIAEDGLCLVVLGQRVLINTTTIIDDSVPGGSLRNVHRGDLVKVSGFVRGNGVIVATLVQRTVGPANFQVKGFVKNHSPRMNRFEIGHLTVDYAAAVMSQMPNPTGHSWDGLLVAVKGSAWNHESLKPYGGTLTARTVEPGGLQVDHPVIDDADVEGYVTQLAAQGDFFVEDVRVQLLPDIIFDGGTASDIRVGVHLDVEGQLTNGVLLATTASFKGNVTLECHVDTVNPETRTLTLAELPGVTVHVNRQTAFEDGGDAGGLNDIRSGDHLIIRGGLITAHMVMATAVERRPPTPHVVLQGPVESATDPTLVILGTVVDTSLLTEGTFRDISGHPIGRTTFFSAAVSSKMVRIQGTLVDGTVKWSDVALDP